MANIIIIKTTMNQDNAEMTIGEIIDGMTQQPDLETTGNLRKETAISQLARHAMTTTNPEIEATMINANACQGRRKPQKWNNYQQWKRCWLLSNEYRRDHNIRIYYLKSLYRRPIRDLKCSDMI